MLAALACDPDTLFSGLCQTIADHDPSGVAGPIVAHLLGPIVVFVAVLAGGRILRRFFERTRVISSDPQVRALIHNVVTVATLVFAALAAMVGAGLNISVLLTFGGLFSLAIGLAFQDLLRNLLAGMFLLIEQPFKLGDTISVGDNTGTVESIQLRTTALRTADGRLAILPNLVAFNQPVVNQSAFDARQSTVTVRIPRDNDLDEAIRQARAVMGATKGISRKPLPMVMPQLDGDANLLHCRYWIEYHNHDTDAVTADVAARLAPLGRAAPVS